MSSIFVSFHHQNNLVHFCRERSSIVDKSVDLTHHLLVDVFFVGTISNFWIVSSCGNFMAILLLDPPSINDSPTVFPQPDYGYELQLLYDLQLHALHSHNLKQFHQTCNFFCSIKRFDHFRVAFAIKDVGHHVDYLLPVDKYFYSDHEINISEFGLMTIELRSNH